MKRYKLGPGQEPVVGCCDYDIELPSSVKCRLRWAGHVIRQDNLSRTVLCEPRGKCPRGRPRLRWEDGVEGDVARLGCRNWKIVALNREGWRKLLKEAEAHHGL